MKQRQSVGFCLWWALCLPGWVTAGRPRSPHCSQPCCAQKDLSQEKTVLERLGGPDASSSPAPSTCLLSLVCTAGACGRRGGEQVLMGRTGGKSSGRKGAGLEEAGPRRHRMWSVRDRAALLFCERSPSPTSGFILLSGPQEQVQGTSGTWAMGQHVQGTRWFRKSWGNRRRAST